MAAKKEINKTVRFDEQSAELVQRLTFILDCSLSDLVRASILIAFSQILLTPSLLRIMDLSDLKVSNLSAITAQARSEAKCG